MGCILVRLFDPAPPDSSIRAFWHIEGLIIDEIDPLAAACSNKSRRNDSGVEGLEASRAATALTPLMKPSGGENHISSLAKVGVVQRLPAGVLFVYNGRLSYRPRRCFLLSRQKPRPLQIDIREIENVNNYSHFTSHKGCKSYPGQVVDLILTSPSAPQPFHIGILTREAEEVCRQLKETCAKHRQKPKIFQFNSVDVDGVEIELP